MRNCMCIYVHVYVFYACPHAWQYSSMHMCMRRRYPPHSRNRGRMPGGSLRTPSRSCMLPYVMPAVPYPAHTCLHPPGLHRGLAVAPGLCLVICVYAWQMRPDSVRFLLPTLPPGGYLCVCVHARVWPHRHLQAGTCVGLLCGLLGSRCLCMTISIGVYPSLYLAAYPTMVDLPYGCSQY